MIELWIPRPPDNANARHHWRKATSLKKLFWQQLEHRQAIGYHIPPVPAHPIPRARVEARYHHTAKRLLDADNAIRRLKPAVDWLVTQGYLAGDDPERLEWTIPEQIIDRNRDAPPLCTVRLRLIPLASEAAA